MLQLYRHRVVSALLEIELNHEEVDVIIIIFLSMMTPPITCPCCSSRFIQHPIYTKQASAALQRTVAWVKVEASRRSMGAVLHLTLLRLLPPGEVKKPRCGKPFSIRSPFCEMKMSFTTPVYRYLKASLNFERGSCGIAHSMRSL